jgi:hypothetical protein
VKRKLIRFTKIKKKHSMKKGMLVLGLAVLGLASCKKEYTCNCTDINGTETVETNKGKDATDACDDASSVVELKTCVPA